MDDVISDNDQTAGSFGRPKPGDWIAEEPAAPTEQEPMVHRLSTCEVTPGGGEVVQQASHPCEDDTWADILYLSGTGTFWLLTQPVSDALHEAADQLAEIVADPDPQSRMERLSDEARLTDCIMPARVENFLNKDKLKSYQEKTRELALEEEEAERSEYGSSPLMQGRRMNELRDSIAALRREGQREAERQGFEIEGERYYGAWEQEIETVLARYRECRQDYVERFIEGEVPVGDAIRYAFRYTALCGGVSPYVARQSCPVEDYAHYLDEQNDSAEAAYIQSILQLAAMGIATPELALADPSRQTPGLQPGVSDFDGYNRLLKELPEIAASMDAKLEDWRDSTAGQTALPIFLLEEERSRYEDYCQRLDAFYETARQTTEAMEPRRALYWNADVTDTRHALGYRKRSVDVLVRNDFPLREFSSPLGSQSLSHLSLHQLAALAMTSEEHERLKQVMPGDGALPAQLWEAPESALAEWLAGRGCQSFEWDPDWHDETLGLFEPARFFAYLDGQEIQVTSLEGRREDWGEVLQHILFTGPSHKVLRLFDASAQAQYLRMVGMSYGDLKEQVAPERPQVIKAAGPSLSLEVMDGSVSAETGSNLEGEAKNVGQRGREREFTNRSPNSASDVSMAGGNASTAVENSDGWQNRQDRGVGAKASYSAKAEAKFNLVAGELSFGTFSLPEEVSAEPIEVTLYNKGDERRSLGCYALRLEPVAKGFSGASAVLAAETGLSVDQNGVSIVGLDHATQAGTAASFKAFAGVGITVQCSVALRWKPPQDILQRLPKYAALDELGMLSEPLDDWGDLSKATLAVEALAGIGAESDFQIGLIDGKFVLTLKARLVLKGGVGGKFSVELDPDRLDPWMGMLHQALVDNDYEVVDWITPAAFDGFSKLFFMQTMLLVDVGMLALRGIDFVNDLYTDFTRSDRAGPIAYELTRPLSRTQEHQRRAWVQQLPPEALGPLLHVLASGPESFDVENQSFSAAQAQDYQQIAIANCLQWLVEGATEGAYDDRCYGFSDTSPNPAQILFEKSVARMSNDGEKTNGHLLMAYAENRKRLDEFMNNTSSHGGSSSRQAFDKRVQYSKDSESLSRHVVSVE
ncbi:hypothetical protein ACJ7V3_17470 [Halomonas elongata]|uniref:hypothetical protein n=1 Tax=Halomonas elongata TaxID=2746 RepID=UPI0038D3DC25